jgi:hypothetical protein
MTSLAAGQPPAIVAAFLGVALALPVSAQGPVIVTDGGQPFSRIDSTWTKPDRRASTIRVKGGAETCPQRGYGGDTETNRRKNRTDSPSQSYLVTLDAIRSLPDTVLWRHRGQNATRESWIAADRPFVYPYEGTPVTVVGYFEIVRPQRSSPPSGNQRVGESTNCHAWAEVDTDWHIALVADPGEREEQSVVIEPTPRFKRRNAGWTVDKARSIAVRRTPSGNRNEGAAQRVRVTGYLMLDPAHPTHIRGTCTSNCASRTFYRATLWEIHPVSRIEVLRGNAWVDLNDY